MTVERRHEDRQGRWLPTRLREVIMFPMNHRYAALYAGLLLLSLGNATPAAEGAWEPFPDGSTGQVTQFHGVGGLTIPAYVRKPKGAGLFPVIVLLHGGGPSKPATYAAARLASPTGDFIQAGWAVYSIDFRPNHSTVRLPPVEIDDTIAAVKAARQLPFVDPKRVGLLGGSHGGH